MRRPAFRCCFAYRSDFVYVTKFPMAREGALEELNIIRLTASIKTLCGKEYLLAKSEDFMQYAPQNKERRDAENNAKSGGCHLTEYASIFFLDFLFHTKGPKTEKAPYFNAKHFH